ncbi:hypothetical protein BDF22DRAFT_696511, partial [Syncephalis plumigaleata]
MLLRWWIWTAAWHMLLRRWIWTTAWHILLLLLWRWWWIGTTLRRIVLLAVRGVILSTWKHSDKELAVEGESDYKDKRGQMQYQRIVNMN